MSDYSTGLCDCFSDVGLCVYTYFCASCSMASNWAMVRGENCTCEHYCCVNNPYWTRQFIRSRKHMPKEACKDCMIFCFCTSCMICQDGRELKAGFGLRPDSEYFAGQQPSHHSHSPQPQYQQPQPQIYPQPPQPQPQYYTAQAPQYQQQQQPVPQQYPQYSNNNNNPYGDQKI